MSGRNAFTLLELLLVLGIVAAILGLGMPTMHGMYLRSQLKGTAQELQGELYRTRLLSMKTGKAYVFRYQGGTSVFEIVPKEVFDQNQKEKDGQGAVAIGAELLSETSSPALPGDSQPTSPIYQKTLPPKIVFSPPPLPSSSIWSPPILFYPNGRTSQASIILQTSGNPPLFQKLILRGLTGTAQLGESRG